MSGFASLLNRQVLWMNISSMRTSGARYGLSATVSNRRDMSSDSRQPLNRPSPPPLPREAQREFEELVRKAQAPLSHAPSNRALAEADLALHPDARAPLQPEFEGEVNPLTGESGGPKREPVKRWVEGDGDWSFKGRVSDF